VSPNPIFCTIGFFCELSTFVVGDGPLVALDGVAPLTEVLPFVVDFAAGRRRDRCGCALVVVVLLAGLSTAFGRDVKNAPRVSS